MTREMTRNNVFKFVCILTMEYTYTKDGDMATIFVEYTWPEFREYS
jgi:hypothetical protein